MILLVVVATIGVLAYGAFLLDPRNRGDLLPYAMVIVAETILVAHALLSMWTILSSGHNPRDFAYHDAAAKLFPGLADGDDTPHLARRAGARGRVHHRLRRGHRHGPQDRRGGPRDTRQAPHLGARRRSVGRRARSRRRTRRLVRPPTELARREGRQHQPCAHARQGRLLRGVRRGLRAPSRIPAGDAPVLRRRRRSRSCRRRRRTATSTR